MNHVYIVAAHDGYIYGVFSDPVSAKDYSDLVTEATELVIREVKGVKVGDSEVLNVL
jgi:hypothetical protein